MEIRVKSTDRQPYRAKIDKGLGFSSGRNPGRGLRLLGMCGVVVFLAALIQLDLARADETISRLAVLNFKARGASPVEAEAVTEEVRRIFVKTKRYVVVDRTLTDRILKEWETQQGGATEGERAVRIGKLYNVQTLVSGVLHKLPDGGWQISGVILNAETGETLSAETLRHRGDFFTLLDEKLAQLGMALARQGSQESPGGTPDSAQVKAKAPVPEPSPAAVPAVAFRRRLAIFPALIQGQYRKQSLEHNTEILRRIGTLLRDDQNLELAEIYNLRDVKGDSESKRSEFLEDKSWSGVFSKDPDLDFLFETGKSKGFHLIFLYKVSIPSCRGEYEVFLLDVQALRKLSRSGTWICVKEGGLSWPRRVVMAFQELLEEANL